MRTKKKFRHEAISTVRDLKDHMRRNSFGDPPTVDIFCMPALARELLQKQHPGNRLLDERRLEQYLDRLQRKEWFEKVGNNVVLKNAQLVDGEHRLELIVRSNQGRVIRFIESPLTIEQIRKTQGGRDGAIPWSGSQYLEGILKNKYPHLGTATFKHITEIGAVFAWELWSLFVAERHGGNMRLYNRGAAAKECAKGYFDQCLFASELFPSNKKAVYNSWVRAAFAKAFTYERESKLVEAAESYKTVQALGETPITPMTLLRMQLLEDYDRADARQKPRQTIAWQKTLAALFAFCSSQRVRKIVPLKRDPYPLDPSILGFKTKRT